MLDGFFRPDSIAVVGVAREEGKVGHLVFDNLRSGGFRGAVYPVNPKAAEIHGVQCFASVREIPVIPDLAVIAIPAVSVPGIVDDCAARGVRSLIVLSAGFRESGPAGGALERDVIERAGRTGIRFLGPNCLGLVATHHAVNASFAGTMPPVGSISFLSQSGALGTAILDWAAGEGVGLAHFVSLGNRADISEADLFDAWSADESVHVIAAYLESVADGARFLDSATRATSRVPVLALKAGVTDAGARAASSHTGALAGNHVAYRAAFHRAGIVQIETVEQLFDAALAFSTQPLPTGRGLVIVTNAGGPAVLASDACEALGLPLASLDDDTLRGLRDLLPPAAAIYNPVDILGDATQERFAAALDLVFADPNVGAVLCITTPQAMTPTVGIAEALAMCAGRHNVTTLACFMGLESMRKAHEVLRRAGIPVYPFPERAVGALSAMHEHVRLTGTHPTRVEPAVTGDAALVSRLLEESRQHRRGFITEHRAAQILDAYGIRVPEGAVASDLSSARQHAAAIGYPIALKVASPDILHKSDIGAIRLGVRDDAELKIAYEGVLGRARAWASDAVVEGVYVQAMAPAGREVIVGVDRDPQFGPLLMFGLGGIYVEVMKDVAFRLCPVNHTEAREMIAEIQAYGLLRGARGDQPADIEAIADVIVRVSALVVEHPEILELDVNPLIVGDAGNGAVAADVRIGIGGMS